ncbi:hypothetical protein [uncultured Paludibaculum sp.]|uniref:hypothetical protein n=1 Tax=uncultured Paludibaculum sp. TaxID=1765020 RepID=UPI002AAB2D86|nr:hypothetical protein [uncultured Paludibaculum sp.]
MPITRRHFAAAMAACTAAAAPSTASLDPDLVRRHDEAVDRILRQQITDPADPHRGGYPDEYGLFSAGTGAGLCDTLIAAYVFPGSRHHKSAEVAGRFHLAAGYLTRMQNSDGTIDLLVTNFHSTPDLGFVTHSAAGAAWIARHFNEPELFAALEPFLRKAGKALATGGIHTPNHRWVVCEALSQVQELLPDPAYPRRIAQWLAEGIDIDSDGQFDERSTTVYNTVSDKALLVTGLKTGRPELLEPVRRNLQAMLYLLHPGGEVVTEISTRQDQYDRAGMDRYWFPLRYFAITENNGQFANLVRSVEPRAGSLSFYLRYPELQKPLPPAQPLPEDFEKLMPAIQIARFRRGPRSASILLNGNSRFFTMRQGGCVVEAVRFASAFFGKGQFRASSYEKTADGYRMTQELEGPYYQPFDPPRRVEASQWGALRSQRRQSNVERMRYTVTVREKGKGFAIDMEAQGTVGVPLAVEVNLRQNTLLDGVTEAPKVAGGFLLKKGYAVARSGGDALRFGPGLSQHTYTQVRGADAKLPGPSVYLCGLTPFKHTLEFEAL